MSLDQLLYEATIHYRSRGFPEAALVHLRWTLVTNVKDGKLCLQTAYPGCNRDVGDLIGYFRPCSKLSTLSDLSLADAVFGFSFGYRMKVWSEDVSPTEQSQVIANRVPGTNNAALAEQARRLHLEYGHQLYLQFEIADAVGTSAKIEYQSSRKDQNTAAVTDEFIEHAEKSKETIRTVVVVAHRYHFERCRVILEKKKITGLPPHDQYSGYDPFEAQPRVMSPDEFIVNDFASMAGLASPPNTTAQADA